jgi:hypothetical protein
MVGIGHAEHMEEFGEAENAEGHRLGVFEIRENARVILHGEVSVDIGDAPVAFAPRNDEEGDESSQTNEGAITKGDGIAAVAEDRIL